MSVPKIPVGDAIEFSIDFLVEHFSSVTKLVSDVTETGIDFLIDGMLFLPPVLLIVLISAIVFLVSRKNPFPCFH